MNGRILALGATLAAFSLYSLYPIATFGYFGFVEVALREPWAMQMLIDLFLALFLFSSWMIPDARSRGIAPWPFVLLTVATGSIGALLYLLVREVKKGKAGAVEVSRSPARGIRAGRLSPEARA